MLVLVIRGAYPSPNPNPNPTPNPNSPGRLPEEEYYPIVAEFLEAIKEK